MKPRKIGDSVVDGLDRETLCDAENVIEAGATRGVRMAVIGDVNEPVLNVVHDVGLVVETRVEAGKP